MTRENNSNNCHAYLNYYLASREILKETIGKIVYESSGSGDMGSGRVFTKPARELTLREARRTLKFFGIEAPEFNMNGKRDYGHFIVRLEYYWLSMVFILKNGSLLYYLVMLLFACAGFKLSIMFYSLMLLDIVGRLPVLQDVIRSVTLNYKELLLTALLGVIIIYIYSTLYFTYFQDHYYDANVDIAIKARNGNLICFNLYHCFLSTLGYGLRGGGGIADSLKPISSNSVNVFYLRYVIDMSFFVIIVTVLLNIVFGIIIDTFAELREGKAAFEQDKNKTISI